ncbi:hypothetical protein DM860_017230 [Cuscuta australis]|uniref:mannan endo-1,4-beta-mannosidase n=1 Tax=Cuscuta australis TaxID=267555 RepID=A0A328E501_9ASTE|nr:hypothetical protein DM860_017230 [Cuscuta australis]
MKNQNHYLGLLLLLMAMPLAIDYPSKQSCVVKAAADQGNEGFIRASGVHFSVEGYPFYANGFNAYWLMYVASDPSQRHKVSEAYRAAASHGLTVARTWAFSDGGYRPLQSSPGSYNQDMFQGLDFVIAEARKYGIKLILSLVNNYESFGGKKQYVNWAKNQAGQQLSSDDDFFTNSVVKGYYKNHIQTVLNRRNSVSGVVYKNDPTIMAWELMNEPRCLSDPSGNTIQVSFFFFLFHSFDTGFECYIMTTKSYSILLNLEVGPTPRTPLTSLPPSLQESLICFPNTRWCSRRAIPIGRGHKCKKKHACLFIYLLCIYLFE